MAAITFFLSIQGTSFLQEKEEEMRLVPIILQLESDYNSGKVFTEKGDVSRNGYGLTILSPDGAILYDLEENFWNRLSKGMPLKELFTAIECKTFPVHTIVSSKDHTVILTGVMLEDGNYMVVTSRLNKLSGTIAQAIPLTSVAMLLALFLSIFGAKVISMFIVRPLDKVDIDEGTQFKYKEIMPFLNRIREQQEMLHQDLKERKELQDKFRSATEGLLEGLVILEKDGKVFYMNTSARRILGIIGEPEGKHYNEVMKNFSLVIEKASYGETSSESFTSNGRTYRMEIVPLLEEDGILSSYSILFLDITDFAEDEKKRREFTSNASHELKTPIHVISGTAELLASGLVKAEDQPQFLNTIRHEAERLSKTVDSIIGLERVENLDEVSMIPLDMADLAADIWKRLVTAAEAYGRDLSVSPAFAPIMGDEAMVKMLIQNLVDNAIKYSGKGCRVQVSTGSDGITSWLEVKDNGVGISKEDQSRIFERFYRVDKARSREVGGTGLGLSLVKKAVELHGGEIKLDSELGKGSTFTVTFPCYAEMSKPIADATV